LQWLQLFYPTDDSTTVNSKIAEIDVHLKEQELIKFFIAEGEKST
jgi:hypothetical protein